MSKTHNRVPMPGTQPQRRRGLKFRLRTAIAGTGLIRLAINAAPKSIAILRYHSIQEDLAPFSNSIGEGIMHSLAVFRQQMEIVAGRFDPVSMDDVLAFLRGKKELPRRPVAITFDDGFADNAELAAPVLNRLGVPATFYVTVNPVSGGRPPWFCRLRHAFGTTQKVAWLDSWDGRVRSLVEPGQRKSAFLVASERCAKMTDSETALHAIECELEVEPFAPGDGFMMSWEQIRGLQKAGHVIGSHTLTHPNLAHVSQNQVLQECVESKKILEAQLGSPIVHFSYPSPILQPHWNQQTVRTTQLAGYHTAVTSTGGRVRAGDNPHHLQRVVAPPSQDEFAWTLDCTFIGRRL